MTRQQREANGGLLPELPDGAAPGWGIQLDENLNPYWAPPVGIFALTRHAILFTETEGDGVYSGSVTVPPGTSILDVAVFCLNGPWEAVSAGLQVGDEAVVDGYIAAGFHSGADLVNTIIKPYDSTSGIADAGVSWTDAGIMNGPYKAASFYDLGGVSYLPTVRYPNGGVITALVTASGYSDPLDSPGQVVADVIGFGVPPGLTNAVKT